MATLMLASPFRRLFQDPQVIIHLFFIILIFLLFFVIRSTKLGICIHHRPLYLIFMVYTVVEIESCRIAQCRKWSELFTLFPPIVDYIEEEMNYGFIYMLNSND